MCVSTLMIYTQWLPYPELDQGSLKINLLDLPFDKIPNSAPEVLVAITAAIRSAVNFISFKIYFLPSR